MRGGSYEIPKAILATNRDAVEEQTDQLAALRNLRRRGADLRKEAERLANVQGLLQARVARGTADECELDRLAEERRSIELRLEGIDPAERDLLRQIRRLEHKVHEGAPVIGAALREALDRYLEDLRAQVQEDLAAILEPIRKLEGQGIAGQALSTLVLEQAWIHRTLPAALAQARHKGTVASTTTRLSDGTVVALNSPAGQERAREIEREAAAQAASRPRPRGYVGMVEGFEG